MNKKLVRIFAIVAILVVAFASVSPVFAEISTDWEGNTSGAGAQKVENMGKNILGIVQIVAGLAAVILLIVLAIKYMVASPEGKADIKKTALIYVVGAALMFGTSMVLGAIKDFMTE
ncbi:MAG: hypothetical protein J6I85_00310 [Clostridia bacterium]|nr:hypothetical protein [Clostridia bacterium]